MKLYTIYSHPSFGEKAVKEGFRYPAFFFTWIWALTKGLWTKAILLFLLTGFTLFFDEILLYQYPENSAAFLLLSLVFTLAISIFAGTSGSEWQKNKLLINGFDEVIQVTSFSAKGAIAVYSKETKDGVPDPAEPSKQNPKGFTRRMNQNSQEAGPESPSTFVFRVPTSGIELEYEGEIFEEVVETFILENNKRLIGSDPVIEIKRQGSESGYLCYDLSELKRIVHSFHKDDPLKNGSTHDSNPHQGGERQGTGEKMDVLEDLERELDLYQTNPTLFERDEQRLTNLILSLTENSRIAVDLLSRPLSPSSQVVHKRTLLLYKCLKENNLKEIIVLSLQKDPARNSRSQSPKGQ